MVSQQQTVADRLELKRNIWRRIFQVGLSILLIAAILFITSGSLAWLYAWIYLIASVLIVAVNALVLPPELISERGRKKENVEKWDRIISGLIILPFFAIFIISGLDFRYRWSFDLPFLAHLMGLIFYVLGNALITWSMVSNAYFSTAVRIQYDREHRVATGGPYALVRHPGYLGMIVYYLATPVALGSIWALWPAFLTVVLLIIRTALEDSTLQAKLKGYKEYAARVRYRLIPGLW